MQEIREREERKLDVFETNADDIQQQQVRPLIVVHWLTNFAKHNVSFCYIHLSTS